MKTTQFITINILGLWLVKAAAFAAAFVPGEILLNNFNGNVQRYSSTGILMQTFGSAPNESWEGASLTPDGNLVTSYRNPSAGIHIFNPAGTQIGSFATGGGDTGDVGVFGNGTLAVNDQPNNVVRLFSQSGTLLSTVNLPGISGPFGSTVGSDNILYIAGFNSNNVAKVSQTGTFLGTISLGFGPADLVMSPIDGTLWIGSEFNTLIQHITTTGTVLGSFSSGFANGSAGIGIAPDGNSLYVTNGGSVIRHLSLNGTRLGDFNIVNPGNALFMTVVPNPTVVPEPSTCVILAFGVGSLFGFRRSRKQ